MKRTLSLCLAALLLTASMASCGGEPVETTPDTDAPAVEETAEETTEE